MTEEQEQEQEQDFGIPQEEDAGLKYEEPKCDSFSVSEEMSPEPKAVKLSRPRKPKAAKAKPQESKLAPLLNEMAAEIEDAMDLLRLVDPSALAIEGARDEFKISILCRKLSAYLLRLEDIRDKLAAAAGIVEG
jgi:hypothetical protein